MSKNNDLKKKLNDDSLRQDWFVSKWGSEKIHQIEKNISDWFIDFFEEGNLKEIRKDLEDVPDNFLPKEEAKSLLNKYWDEFIDFFLEPENLSKFKWLDKDFFLKLLNFINSYQGCYDTDPEFDDEYENTIYYDTLFDRFFKDWFKYFQWLDDEVFEKVSKYSKSDALRNFKYFDLIDREDAIVSIVSSSNNGFYNNIFHTYNEGYEWLIDSKKTIMKLIEKGKACAVSIFFSEELKWSDYEEIIIKLLNSWKEDLLLDSILKDLPWKYFSILSQYYDVSNLTQKLNKKEKFTIKLQNWDYMKMFWFSDSYVIFDKNGKVKELDGDKYLHESYPVWKNVEELRQKLDTDGLDDDRPFVISSKKWSWYSGWHNSQVGFHTYNAEKKEYAINIDSTKSWEYTGYYPSMTYVRPSLLKWDKLQKDILDSIFKKWNEVKSSKNLGEQ